MPGCCRNGSRSARRARRACARSPMKRVRRWCSTARPMPMAVRSEPDQKFDNVKPAEFKVRGCEIAVPPGTIAGVLDGKTLPLARPESAAHPDVRRYRMPAGGGQRVPGLQRSRRVAVCADLRARGDDAPRSRDPCRRLSLSRIRHARRPTAAAPGAPGATAGTPGTPISSSRRRRCSPPRPGSWCAAITRTAAAPAKAGSGFMDRAPIEKSCRDLTGIFVARLGDFGVVVVDGAKAADPKGDPSAAGRSAARPDSRDRAEGAGGGLDGEPPPVEFHARSGARPAARTRSTTRAGSKRSAR